MVLDAHPATADRELLHETVEALRHSSRGLVLLVLAGLRAQAGSDTQLDPAFGPEPSAGAYQEALAGSLSRATERRQELMARSLTRDQVADRLGVSAQAVSGMLERGALVGIKQGRTWRIPGWQLDEEAPAGVVPGSREVAARFPGGVVTLSLWVEREHPDLDGMTPRAALRQGRVGQVLRLVAAL